MKNLGTDEKQKVYSDFNSLTNMSPSELEKWLATDDSKSVGWKEDSEESIGHQSGRLIVKIKKKHKADLSDDDYEHMQKVVGYIKRHSAQEPQKERIEDSRWRYSLMNWGHDPEKKH